MNSFNVYGQTEKKVGGNTPVWLGTVKPIPRGGVIALRAGEPKHVSAGTPVTIEPNGEVSIWPNAEMASQNANGYIYNDVHYEGKEEDVDTAATCAVVMHHPEGLLIERVYPEITEEQIAALQAKIPGVLLVRG